MRGPRRSIENNAADGPVRGWSNKYDGLAKRTTEPRGSDKQPSALVCLRLSRHRNDQTGEEQQKYAQPHDLYV